MTANPAPGFKTNPGKRMTIEPFTGEVTVRAGDVVVARSRHAKLLREDSHPPVTYIPFADIDFAGMEKTERSTHCPYKGDASYWTIKAAGAQGDNAMWAYEHPFDEAGAIADHGAFYTNKVTLTADPAP